MKNIYLDYAATTPTDPEVLKSMLPFFNEYYGNPSSVYTLAQKSREAIENSRLTIANFIGAKPEEIVFTGGGSESNNFALKGIAFANQSRGNHIITTAIEHHAVINPCKFLEKMGFKITYIPVDKNGLIDPTDVEKAVNKRTILISVMHANNEIGTIEPISDVGKIAKSRGVYFHTDAVQTFGHIPVDVNELNVDLLSVSAHKLYGPKGVGALYIRSGVKIEPLIHGGDQERRRRASTENVPGILGFGKSVEIANKIMFEEADRESDLRDNFINMVLDRIEDVRLNGHPTNRLPNNINLSFQGIEGESILLHLDMDGIAASTGSACSSSNLKPSHVLLALGLSHEQAHGSVRFTIGRYTVEEELNYVVDVLEKVVKKLRAMSPLYKKIRGV